MPQKSTPKHITFNLQIIKDKEKILKNARGEKNTLSIEQR